MQCMHVSLVSETKSREHGIAKDSTFVVDVRGKIFEYVGVTKKQPSDQPIKLELRNKEIQEYFENNGWPRFRSRILSITIKMTFTMFETNIALPEYASVIPAKKSKIQRAILSEFRMTIVSDIPRVKRGRNHFRCMD